MLKIRLARIGKKKRPAYRFIVSDSTKDTFGRALEIVGNYNPFSKVVEVKKDRILYWISKGAQISPTAHNLLVDQNVISKEKVRASKSGKKRKDNQQKTAEIKPEQVAKPVAEIKTEEKPAEENKVEETRAEEKKEEKSKVEEVKKEAGDQKLDEKIKPTEEKKEEAK